MAHEFGAFGFRRTIGNRRALVHTARVLRALFFSRNDHSQRHGCSLALNRFSEQSLSQADPCNKCSLCNKCCLEWSETGSLSSPTSNCRAVAGECFRAAFRQVVRANGLTIRTPLGLLSAGVGLLQSCIDSLSRYTLALCCFDGDFRQGFQLTGFFSLCYTRRRLSESDCQVSS
jgi:hypothetical protein